MSSNFGPVFANPSNPPTNPPNPIPQQPGVAFWPYTIPARMVYTDQDPRPHCSPRQVMSVLLGTNLQNFLDCNGTLDAFNTLVNLYIQEVTDFVVKELRSPYDFCYVVRFFDGSGGPVITLPDRNILEVTTVFIRILPSNVWYHFVRPRKLDGSEFLAIGSQEPFPPGPETFPINVYEAAVNASGPIYPTGIEDADLLVDTRRRTLTIPPRVLYAGVSLPLWNYTFTPGDMNIETHYSFGFPPINYLDGTPLQFNPPGTADPPGNGLVIQTKPGTGGDTGTPAVGIDWSSGIPAGVSMAVARLVANRIRRQNWYSLSNGLASLSVDGASESYGSEPYGGAIDKDDENIIKTLLSKYANQMVI